MTRTELPIGTGCSLAGDVVTGQSALVDEIRIRASESMFILDGGPGSELPTGSGGPVLAGRGAIFVAGRVAADASTVVRIGPAVGHGDLVLAYEGDLETPDSELRLLNILGDVLAVVSVCSPVTRITIYLSDLAEPDEVLVAATLV